MHEGTTGLHCRLPAGKSLVTGCTSCAALPKATSKSKTILNTKRNAGLADAPPARLKESLLDDRGWAAARPKSRHRQPAHTGAFFKFSNRLRSQKKTTYMLCGDSLSRTRHVHLPAHSVHKDSANFYAEYPPKETNTRGSRKQLWNLLPKGGFSAENLHEPSSTNILRLVAVNSPAAHLIRSEDEAVSTKIIK